MFNFKLDYLNSDATRILFMFTLHLVPSSAISVVVFECHENFAVEVSFIFVFP